MSMKAASGTSSSNPAGEIGDSSGASVRLRNLSRSFGTVRALAGLNLDLAPASWSPCSARPGAGRRRPCASWPASRRPTREPSRWTARMCPRFPRPSGHGHGVPELQPVPQHVGAGQRGFRAADAETGRYRAGTPGQGTAGHGRPRRPGRAVPAPAVRWPAAAGRAGGGIAMEPRVLLLDEPLSALDAKVRLQLREQIRSLQQRLGTTTLFVTHDQEEALSMADRVGVMGDGTLEQIASPSELYAHPATAFVAEFVGIMNRIPSELLSRGSTRAGARPLTQMRPKLRTLAPREPGSRSRWTTSWPSRLASSACIMPSTPPPTPTTVIPAVLPPPPGSPRRDRGGRAGPGEGVRLDRPGRDHLPGGGHRRDHDDRAQPRFRR